ncbi:MAG: hypothetical protein IJU76_10520, partial [Desulfovibrionaceae bacterium]|nr:hypothetical protein [Desulfovibrionaceae bacterium]
MARQGQENVAHVSVQAAKIFPPVHFRVFPFTHFWLAASLSRARITGHLPLEAAFPTVRCLPLQAAL